MYREILLPILTAAIFCRPTSGNVGEIRALYDENIYARIWRNALTGPPSIHSEDGWPQYTQGAHHNTPPSDTDPVVYVSTAADGWTAGFFPDMLWQLYKG